MNIFHKLNRINKKRINNILMNIIQINKYKINNKYINIRLTIIIYYEYMMNK